MNIINDLSSRKKKVLIVDDEKELKCLLSNLLSDWDMKVCSTSNGRDAMENIEHDSPDIIIMDSKLPDINGFDLCKRLRSHSKTRKIPIVFLTTKTTVSEKIKGLDSGADDYITRPFNTSELIARLRAVMRSYCTI